MDALTILYQDDYLVAVDKPPALLVHRSNLSGDKVFALQTLRNQLGRLVYPVHRLDRPTSGVLLFALSPEIAAAMGQLFEAKRATKRYLALLRGVVDESGRIESELTADGDGISQSAATRFNRLATFEEPSLSADDLQAGKFPWTYSWVEAFPETGRWHQIRRHFRHIRHPVIGDTKHGDGKHNRHFREKYGVTRLMLFAESLRCPHPVTGVVIEIHAPLPDAMAISLERLANQRFC